MNIILSYFVTKLSQYLASVSGVLNFFSIFRKILLVWGTNFGINLIICPFRGTGWYVNETGNYVGNLDTLSKILSSKFFVHLVYGKIQGVYFQEALDKDQNEDDILKVNNIKRGIASTFQVKNVILNPDPKYPGLPCSL